MRKIIFFTENNWAFGSIHNALCKLLYRYDILAEVVDWRVNYQKEELKNIVNNCDYIVSHPCVTSILAKDYDISPHKMIIVSHGQSEMLICLERLGKDMFNHFHEFAVVSDIMKHKAAEFGITRIPKIVPLGIHIERYLKPLPKKLERVGYAGAFTIQNRFGQEIKRGHLVKQACDNANLEFVDNKKFHYMAMPSFYESVDCVVMSSIEESVGLTMLEGAAAGRLTIGTPVGYHEHNRNGLVAPLSDTEFVEFVSQALVFFKTNPDLFIKKCQEVQQYAKQNFDWEQNIAPWVDLLK